MEEIRTANAPETHEQKSRGLGSYVVWAFVAVVILGVALWVATRTRSPEFYYVVFVNETGHDLGNVCAYHAGVEIASAGVLVKEGRAREGPIRLSIPIDMEVRWDEGANHNTSKLSVDGTILTELPGGTLQAVLKTNGGLGVQFFPRLNTEH